MKLTDHKINNRDCSPTLLGEALTIEQFKNWIQESEQGHSITLAEAKKLWGERKKLLQLMIKSSY